MIPHKFTAHMKRVTADFFHGDGLIPRTSGILAVLLPNPTEGSRAPWKKWGRRHVCSPSHATAQNGGIEDRLSCEYYCWESCKCCVSPVATLKTNVRKTEVAFHIKSPQQRRGSLATPPLPLYNRA